MGKEKLLKKVENHIDEKKEDIINFLRELIKFPSITNDEGSEVQNFIMKKLKELDFNVDIWEPDIEELKKHPGFAPVKNESYKNRPNLVGVHKGLGGGRSLVLNGHIDVVPVEDSSKWSHDPWGGEIKEGKIFGRGALDMKGGDAAIIMAAESVIQSGIKLKGDLTTEFVVEEESSGNGSLACALRGYKADAGIIPEPMQHCIVVSNRGAQFFRIRVFGEESWLEERWNVVNAIDKAMLLYEAVNHFAKIREVEVKKLSSYFLYDYKNLSIEDETIKKIFKENTYKMWNTKVPTGVCKLSAGAWPSSIPGECIMEGSLECLPGENIDEVKDKFLDYIYEISLNDPWLKEHPPIVEWFGLWLEPSIIDVNHPIISTVAESCKKTLKVNPPVIGGGGSDLRCLTKYASTPSILFGPCGGGAHGADEYCDIDSLIACVKIFASTIIDWCGIVE